MSDEDVIWIYVQNRRVIRDLARGNFRLFYAKLIFTRLYISMQGSRLGTHVMNNLTLVCVDLNYNQDELQDPMNGQGTFNSYRQGYILECVVFASYANIYPLILTAVVGRSGRVFGVIHRPRLS